MSNGGGPSSDDELTTRAYAKVTRRLIPLLFVCYVVAYLDRVNVGFAKLQMLADLQLSETIYGLGAGIFFIGYFIFEVPSNLALHRFGARRWIARIMLTWGVVSSLTMFVKTPAMFYGMRFLLGVAEAGFFPGVILYLTYWYPAHRRARITALFMAAIPVSGVFGSPVSGWIMQQFAGVNDWKGWQWLFLIEGLPSVAFGLVTLLYLDDSIRGAKWLTEEEKTLLEAAVAKENEPTEDSSIGSAFRSGRVWLTSLIYFCLVMGVYGIGFWLPSLIKATGTKTPFAVGLLTAIPYTAATIAMIFTSRSSDRRRERRWHVAIPGIIGGIGLIASTLSGNTVLAMFSLSLATLGIFTALPLFWSLPTSFLRRDAAAAGIAIVNSMGNLAGFVSPYLVGYVKDATHSTNFAMYLLAGCLFLAATLVVTTIPAQLVDR
jgi:MFS family permease